MPGENFSRKEILTTYRLYLDIIYSRKQFWQFWRKKPLKDLDYFQYLLWAARNFLIIVEILHALSEKHETPASTPFFPPYSWLRHKIRIISFVLMLTDTIFLSRVECHLCINYSRLVYLTVFNLRLIGFIRDAFIFVKLRVFFHQTLSDFFFTYFQIQVYLSAVIVISKMISW